MGTNLADKVKGPDREDGFPADANFEFELLVDDVCVTGGDEECMSEAAEETTDIKFVATRATGTFSRDPFERVDFWLADVNGQSWLLGSDDSGTSDRGNDGRTWTYSLDNVSGAMLQMATRESDFPPGSNSDAHTVRAFAVNGDGVALVSSAMVMIDDGDDSN